MKKNNFLFILAAMIIILFVACNSEDGNAEETTKTEEIATSEAREKLYKEVMKIHDDVMPKMSDINRAKRKLRDYIEIGSTLEDPVKSKINTIITELVIAERGMEDWMQTFRKPKGDTPEAEAIAYLNNEKAKISEVSDRMLKSLEAATQMLEQLKTKAPGK